MSKSTQLRILAIFFVAVAACLATAGAAHAQATRTWVSGVGDDANPCSRTAPCKTFAGAISKTAPCGEIDVLDPGGFGALTITKCISIEAEEFAGVLVSGTNAFIVAAQPGDQVVIRGITFDGLGTGLNGIKIQSGGTVIIENCSINNFINEGVDAESNANLLLSIKDTNIRNIAPGGAAPNGFAVFVKPSGGTTKVYLDNVRAEHNLGGLRVDPNGQVTARRSIFSNNTNNGVLANGGIVNLESCMASNNGANGVAANSGVATISNGAVFNNGSFGLNNVGGTFTSFGNNSVRGNTSGDLNGTINNVGQQ